MRDSIKSLAKSDSFSIANYTDKISSFDFKINLDLELSLAYRRGLQLILDVPILCEEIAERLPQSIISDSDY